jgi:hypothetical protein
MLSLIFVGCITLQIGALPKVERLGSLKVGTSQQSDVLMTLGEPRGKGMMRFAQDMPLRSIWFYEYIESDGKSTKLRFLLVYFNEDTYDGYLWFFAGQELKRTITMEVK